MMLGSKDILPPNGCYNNTTDFRKVISMKKYNRWISVILITALILALPIGCLTPLRASANSIVPLEKNASKQGDALLADADYVENEIIVQMKDSYSKKELKKELSQELPDTISDIKVEEMVTLDQTCGALLSSDKADTETLLEELNQLDDVAYAEPNYIFHKADITNDTYVRQQWYLEDNDSSDSDIHYTEVSKNQSDTPVVVVADSGIDGSQEDLSQIMYSNTMYDAVRDTYTNYKDSDGHGTHIAGIIGASINNNKGISGISNCKLIGTRCLNDAGECSLASLIRTYNYILSMKNGGVNIRAVNLSMGGQMDLKYDNNGSILNNLITAAGELGIVTICAAGNEGMNIDSNKVYPASFDNDYIISVGASNEANTPASFSNYGKAEVDVFAPGTNIFSTYSSEIYNPECSHDIFYNNFENTAQIADVVNGSSNTTLFLSNQFSALTSSDSDVLKEQNSLCMSVNATANQTYYIALPFTVNEDIERSAYLSFRMLLKASTKAAQIRYHDLAIYISNTSDLSSIYNEDTEIINSCPDISDETDIPYKVNATNDYWNNFPFEIADRHFPLSAGDYYTIIAFTPALSASYELYFDNYGAGTALTKYSYDHGSSMATPMVTGEVALLAGIFPNASAAELRARVLGGIDTSSAYLDKCSTGGKINIAKAMNSPNPAITKLTLSEDTNQLTINGFYFGEQIGSLSITSDSGQTISLPVTSWNPSQITASTTGLEAGSYTVTVTRSDQISIISAKKFTYIGPITINEIKLNKTKLTLAPGKKFKLKATIIPTTAPKQNLAFKSSNAKYATVSQSGIITAKKAGNKHSVTITCYSTDSKKSSASCKVTIKQPVTKIKLNKTKATVKAGKSITLKATITPKNAANKKVVFISSNKKYATVNKKGKVTTKKAGKGHTVTITCKAKDGSKCKKSCRIKIR